MVVAWEGSKIGVSGTGIARLVARVRVWRSLARVLLLSLDVSSLERTSQ